MDEMQTLNYEQLTNHGDMSAKFITLTYPRQYPDVKTAKQHLDKFRKRLRRRFPKACGVWKLELQKRGAPHFHLMMFQLPKVKKEIISQMWAECVGFEYLDYSPNSLTKNSDGTFSGRNPMTRIEEIRSLRGVASYIAKYIAKQDGQNSEKAVLNDTAATAGIYSVPYLTARSLKQNFHIVETIVNRAHTCGENIFFENEKECGMSHDEQLRQWIGVCIQKYAFPDELEKLCPSCGRIWGKHNKAELEKIKPLVEHFFVAFDSLLVIKKFAQLMRRGLRVNKDDKGFTFYLNGEVEREGFYKLLSSEMLNIDYEEGVPF